MGRRAGGREGGKGGEGESLRLNIRFTGDHGHEGWREGVREGWRE